MQTNIDIRCLEPKKTVMTDDDMQQRMTRVITPSPGY